MAFIWKTLFFLNLIEQFITQVQCHNIIALYMFLPCIGAVFYDNFAIII